MTMLKAEKLNKFFYEPEKFQVLKDINLSVNKGEFIALTGKSGSGKSTLLYLLSTMDTEYEGCITIDTTCVTGMSNDELAKFRNQNIGFIFQFHYLLPEFTALENVMIPALKLGKYGREKIEADAMQKLKQMGMDQFALKQADKLSGGQQQRVAIARALINHPMIIMADEPTGNLDSTNSRIVFDLFRELVTEGNTIITVTHDTDFAHRTDRIIELADGQLAY